MSEVTIRPPIKRSAHQIKGQGKKAVGLELTLEERLNDHFKDYPHLPVLVPRSPLHKQDRLTPYF